MPKKEKELIEILKNSVIEPVEYVEKSKLTASERKIYEQRGIEVIKKGKYAVVTMEIKM